MNGKNKKTNNTSKAFIAVVLVAVLVIVGIFLTNGKDADNDVQNDSVQEAANPDSIVNDKDVEPEENEPSSEAAANGEGITITNSEITEEASFIPYKVGNTKMEVIAVRATDGTIRTALNTCQVCNNSGRGYYVQEDDELVCQNCGNRFNIDQIEKQRNGCNPVPIDEKTDDGTTITISDELLASAIPLFKRWK